MFRQDSSCPAVLWIPTAFERFRVRDFYPLSFGFPAIFHYLSISFLGPSPQTYYYLWFGLLRFRSPLLSESLFYFLFLRVIRCFSSPGSLRYTMDLYNDNTILLVLSSLIRISTDHGIFASPRSFSQLVTSFFGAMCQGIHLYALRSLIFDFSRSPSN